MIKHAITRELIGRMGPIDRSSSRILENIMEVKQFLTSDLQLSIRLITEELTLSHGMIKTFTAAKLANFVGD